MNELLLHLKKMRKKHECFPSSSKEGKSTYKGVELVIRI